MCTDKTGNFTNQTNELMFLTSIKGFRWVTGYKSCTSLLLFNTTAFFSYFCRSSGRNKWAYFPKMFRKWIMHIVLGWQMKEVCQARHEMSARESQDRRGRGGACFRLVPGTLLLKVNPFSIWPHGYSKDVRAPSQIYKWLSHNEYDDTKQKYSSVSSGNSHNLIRSVLQWQGRYRNALCSRGLLNHLW